MIPPGAAMSMSAITRLTTTMSGRTSLAASRKAARADPRAGKRADFHRQAGGDVNAPG